jgi:hypothetical protein
MATFVYPDVGRKNPDILLPLEALIRQLPLVNPIFWAFRNVEFSAGNPFGISTPQFEKLSRDLSIGFVVGDQDFRTFLEAGLQMLDGIIDVYVISQKDRLLEIECHDSTEWRLKTESPELMQAFTSRGFVRRD